MQNSTLRSSQSNPQPRSLIPQLFAGLVALSAALIASSLIGANAIRQMKLANNFVTIVGSAKRPIVSDYAILKLSVSGQKPTPQAAYQELKSRTERVRRYLKEQQIPENTIQLKAIQTTSIPEVVNGRETGKTLAYRLSQSLEIRSNDVNRIAQLSQQATDLINEGIPLVSEPPEYLYTKLSELRIQMVAEATKDAKARAEAIAQSTGDRVGALRSAETGAFQITSRYSTDVSDSGIYDTSSIEKDITAVVSATFVMD